MNELVMVSGITFCLVTADVTFKSDMEAKAFLCYTHQ